MSRITGSEAKSLMEAYAAIYAPQEITEEQIWEEVENWVNSLLEEGYDLSEYTWEEMYEAYLEEIKLNQQQLKDLGSEATKSGLQRTFAAGGGRAALLKPGATFQSVFKQGAQNLKAKPAGAPAAPRPAGAPAAPRPAGAPAAPRPAAGTPARPAAAPAAAKVAPTRPAASAKPATGMLGKTSFERRTPTSAELKAAQAARASGASAEKALQAAKSAGTTAKIQSAGQEAGAKAFKAPEVKQTAALAATPKPTPVAPRQTAREKMLNQSYEYDAFDLVLEYLIDNGHVETVDEALYVMMEMDAEVIRDIVEEVINEDAKYDRNRKRAAQRAAARNAARDAGQTGAVPGVGYVTPRRESETYRDSAGVERHKTGARMPKKD
jgi:hypothetical protein